MQRLDPNTVPLDGTNLIEASAGTGKTYTITTLFVRLLLERGLAVSEILVVTYTRAATAELRERIRSRLRQALAALEDARATGDAVLDGLVAARRRHGTVAADRDRLSAALRGFDEAAIFTIHGFCQRTLGDHAFESGAPFEIEFLTDQAPLLLELAQDFWARELYAAHPLVARHVGQELDPGTLAELARKVVANPSMPVLPDSSAADLAVAIEKCQAARREPGRLWCAHREEILALLAASIGMRKGSYVPETMRGEWGPQLDEYFAGDDPRPPLVLEKKLTPERLRHFSKKGFIPPSHAFFDACAGLVDAAESLKGALDAQVLALRLAMVEYARRELPQRKGVAGVQSFDDLLVRLAEALAGPEGPTLAAGIRGAYKAALIDEFQDTDPIQYAIFRAVYHRSDAVLFQIGDPKQAIYAFRGADIFAYLRAVDDAGERAFTLDVNWRSDPRLLRAVGSLFGGAVSPFLYDRIGFVEVHPCPDAFDGIGGALAGAAPFEVLFAPLSGGRGTKTRLNKTWGDRALPALVAAEIVRKLRAGGELRGEPLRPGHFAVLCRTNRQARGTQAALRALGVPAVLEGDSSVFDTEEAVELDRVLRAVAAPTDAAALRSALTTEVLGLRGDDLVALQDDEAAWETWVEAFGGWHRRWQERGFIQAFRALLSERDVEARILRLPDGERRLTNLLHLAELLHAQALEAHLGPLSLLRWFDEMRDDESKRAAAAVHQAAQIRLESDARAVKLTTIHKSKGLEYDIVYCPFVWDGRLLFRKEEDTLSFHDRDDGDTLKLDLGSADLDAHLVVAREEALAENLRLLYVALTRARRQCSVVWGPFKGIETSALGYLLHQAAGALPAADLSSATTSRIAAMDEVALRQDLARLVAASEGAVRVVDLDASPEESWQEPAHDGGALGSRRARRALSHTFRTSSFSALVRGAEAVSSAEEEGVDHDGALELGEPGVAAGGRVPLADFPAGTTPGHLVHEILELADFQDRASLETEVCESLARYAFDASLAPSLAAGLDLALHTELGPTGPRLCDVPRGERLDELEFLFPIAAEPPRLDLPANQQGPLTPARLAAVFRRHGAPAAAPGYADVLAKLPFAALEGYLKGFVDLVFRHEGRFYVVDYKTNLLGPRVGDYQASRLTPAMLHHHYILQYHLYTVALHRYLTLRSPGYDYGRDFGGVCYLFLRGMAPSHPPGTGVFADRPSRSLVHDLSALLAGGPS